MSFRCFRLSVSEPDEKTSLDAKGLSVANKDGLTPMAWWPMAVMPGMGLPIKSTPATCD
jgi:hypothetical protein